MVDDDHDRDEDGDESYSDMGFTPRERDEVEVPRNFESWPRENQEQYLELTLRRADLLGLLRSRIGSERSSDRLNKWELAAIALELDAV